MTTEKLSNRSRTPLRYPGGKGKISGFVANILDLNSVAETYIEPFAGGAGVAINLLLSNRVKNIVINDLDDGVYSFWSTVADNPKYLLKMIQEVPFDYPNPHGMSSEEYSKYWSTVKKRFKLNRYSDIRLKGFDFFMLNRMNVSGIVKGGPIGGIAQTGVYNIAARFNKKTLSEKIEQIAAESSRITVTNFEASHFCRLLSENQFCDIERSLLFVDPPYYAQGKHLYNYYATDRIHTLVSERLINEGSWNWILTYDKAPQINALYPDDSIQKYEYQINYSANKRGKFAEFMFASHDLKLESFDTVELQSLSSAHYH